MKEMEDATINFYCSGEINSKERIESAGQGALPKKNASNLAFLIIYTIFSLIFVKLENVN